MEFSRDGPAPKEVKEDLVKKYGGAGTKETE